MADDIKVMKVKSEAVGKDATIIFWLNSRIVNERPRGEPIKGIIVGAFAELRSQAANPERESVFILSVSPVVEEPRYHSSMPDKSRSVDMVFLDLNELKQLRNIIHGFIEAME